MQDVLFFQDLATGAVRLFCIIRLNAVFENNIDIACIALKSSRLPEDRLYSFDIRCSSGRRAAIADVVVRMISAGKITVMRNIAVYVVYRFYNIR